MKKRYIISKEDQRPKPRAILPPNRVEKNKKKYNRKPKHERDESS